MLYDSVVVYLVETKPMETSNTPNEHEAASPMESEVKSPLRPTFLTVLCILSFIGSGFGLIDALTDYIGAPIAEDSIEMVDEEMDEAMSELEESEAPESMINFFEAFMGDIQDNMTAEKIRQGALGIGLSCLLTLIGAIMMWMLKKNGFYVYLAGILLFILTPILVYSGYMATMMVAINGFIGVMFSILYGVNVKHLR